MRVLVTGHLGYIGAVLVPRLATLGHEVHGLDTGLYDGCDFGPAPIGIPEFRLDVRDVETRHLDGFDAVIHLAALSNDPLGDVDPELTYDINYRASVRLASCAREAGVGRFLFSSSCSLYGAAGEAPLGEGSGFAPQTPYGESKILAEQDLTKLATADFSPVYLRNATVYGASPRLRCDLVVNNLVGYALTTGEVLLKSDGTAWRPLVHVEDVCAAFEALLVAPRQVVHDRAFNVGRPDENYRIRDVARIVEETVEGTRVRIEAGASVDTRNYRVDFGRITSEVPAFAPHWTVAEGARQLLDAYRTHGMTSERFESARFFRIRTVRARQAAGTLGADLRPIA
jgi:nucleoside-diphosphate-sugar epimerase